MPTTKRCGQTGRCCSTGRCYGMGGGLRCALGLLLLIAAPAAAEMHRMTLPMPVRAMPDPVPWVDPCITHAGSTLSQGDADSTTFPGAVQAAAARSTFGVDGAGVVIGVISDSFDAFGQAAAGVLSGDLPGPGNPAGYLTPVQVLKDDLSPFSIDEGRAMAEIIHDLAPGTTLLFHSAFNNGPDESSIAFAIEQLRAAGADIIVDDVAYLTQPFYQDGLAARASNAAFAAGAVHCSSAGNSGRNAYEDALRIVADGGTDFYDFDPGPIEDLVLDVFVPAGGSLRVTLQWTEAYPSLSSGAALTANDFELVAVDAVGDVIDVSAAPQDLGADPWELVQIVNETAATQTYGLVIVADAVADPNVDVKLVLFGSGEIFDDNATASPTVFGHSVAAGALSTAAVFYGASAVESFSGRGPGRILFDDAGDPVFEIRAKPQVAAADGVNTTFFGGDVEGDGFPNFFGTSAAAPHAAAVSALLLERSRQRGRDLTPTETYAILQDTAADLGPAGFDDDAGAGLIDALAAVARVDVVVVLGDFTRDGVVTGADAAGFLACFAGGGGDCGLADLNSDGVVNLNDAALFQIAVES